MDSNPSRYHFAGADLAKFKKDSVSLYRGIALLKMGKPATALPHFQRSVENMKNYVSNASEWYLALTFLKLKKTEQAAYLFHKVAETEIHPYQNEAEVIYQRLTRPGKR